MQLQTHETPPLPLHIRTAHFSQERVSMLPRPFCGDYRTQFDTQIRAELGAAEAYRYTPLHHKQSISDGVINQHPDPPHWRRPVCLQLKPITSCPGGGVCEACKQNKTDGRETAAISCIFWPMPTDTQTESGWVHSTSSSGVHLCQRWLNNNKTHHTKLDIFHFKRCISMHNWQASISAKVSSKQFKS